MTIPEVEFELLSLLDARQSLLVWRRLFHMLCSVVRRSSLIWRKIIKFFNFITKSPYFRPAWVWGEHLSKLWAELTQFGHVAAWRRPGWRCPRIPAVAGGGGGLLCPALEGGVVCPARPGGREGEAGGARTSSAGPGWTPSGPAGSGLSPSPGTRPAGSFSRCPWWWPPQLTEALSSRCLRENVGKPATSRQMANGLSVGLSLTIMFKSLITCSNFKKRWLSRKVPQASHAGLQFVKLYSREHDNTPGLAVPREPNISAEETTNSSNWSQIMSPAGQRGTERVSGEYLVGECHCNVTFHPGRHLSRDSSGHKTETVSSYSNSCGERSQCWPSVALRGLKVKTWYRCRGGGWGNQTQNLTFDTARYVFTRYPILCSMRDYRLDIGIK